MRTPAINALHESTGACLSLCLPSADSLLHFISQVVGMFCAIYIKNSPSWHTKQNKWFPYIHPQHLKNLTY